MPVISDVNIIQYLITVMKKFKIHEFETEIMPYFPEFSWEDIKYRVQKEHLKLITNNAIAIMQSDLQSLNIDRQVLWDRLSTLELIEVTKHSEKRHWYCHKLKGLKQAINDVTAYKTNQDNVIQTIYQNKKKLLFKMMTYNDMTFLSLKEKPKRGTKVQYIGPTFFALFIGQNYFFCSRKNVDKSLIEVVTKSLGYVKSKQLSLDGKDLKSLSSMFNINKQGTVPGCDEIPLFMDSEPIEKENGIDFTQHKQRAEFMKKHFGNEPLKLESLNLTVLNYSWRDTDPKLNLSKHSVTPEWEFRSHNIFSMLPKLAEQSIIVSPIPKYISNLVLSGKNKMMIQ